MDGDLLHICSRSRPTTSYPHMPVEVSETEIIRQHDKLIRYLCEPFVAFVMDDLIQEARIALLLAARRYDPSRGVELWTYARKFVLGAVLRVVARELNRPDGLSDRYVETDQSTPDDGSRIVNLPAVTETPEDAVASRELVLKALNTLTEREFHIVFDRFKNDKDVSDIATSFEVTDRWIQILLAGALASMRERAA